MVLGERPESLHTKPAMRFAELIYDKRFHRLIAVCQDQRKDDEEAVNSIVAISLDGSGDFRILASGADFYSSPKISSDGKRLAWVSWNHPNMPWDSTKLYTADFSENGKLGKPILIAGEDNESIAQPEWAPDGTLYFVSDRNNWWNIYRLWHGKVEAVCASEAEFVRPSWHLGYSAYAFLSNESLICSFNKSGFWHLGLVDLETKSLTEIDSEYTDIWWLRVVAGKAVFRGASPTKPQAVVAMDLRSKEFSTIVSSTNLNLDSSMISTPELIEFPSGVGVAYGLYYRAKNSHFVGPDGEKPPLLVRVHGGPTGIASTMLNLEIQFWTSRGFAVLDVNYRGSVGFGRHYRQQLNGQWGLADVEDCVSGAQYLAKLGEIDPDRLLIAGGSAGGFTVLCAATFTQTFKAGASYYGISDLEAMTLDTHKFESRYLENLVGPYPKRRDLYRSRSAIHHTDKLSCPLIFLQGLEDKIVPPNQTVMMMEALKKKGLPVACIMFEGEQHGFRRAETIRRSLESELYFYSRVFGFNLPSDISPIEISNLP